MQEIERLKELRNQDKSDLKHYQEMKERAEKEHLQHMNKANAHIDRLTASIIVWDSLIEKVRNAS